MKTHFGELFEFLKNFDDKFDGDFGEGYSFSYNRRLIPESAVTALSGIYTKGHTTICFETLNAADETKKKYYDRFLDFIRETCESYLRYSN
jgi:hypothetical protein